MSKDDLRFHAEAIQRQELMNTRLEGFRTVN